MIKIIALIYLSSILRQSLCKDFICIIANSPHERWVLLFLVYLIISLEKEKKPYYSLNVSISIWTMAGMLVSHVPS